MFGPMRSACSLVMSLLILCVLAAVALADTGTPPTDDAALLELFRAVVDGKWGWLAGVALIFAIEPAKRFLAARVRFFARDLGGLVLAFLMAAGVGVGHALIADAPWTSDLALAIARNWLVAIGGYKAIKLALVNQFPGLGKIVGAPLPVSEVAVIGTVVTHQGAMWTVESVEQPGASDRTVKGATLGLVRFEASDIRRTSAAIGDVTKVR